MPGLDKAYTPDPMVQTLCQWPDCVRRMCLLLTEVLVVPYALRCSIYSSVFLPAQARTHARNTNISCPLFHDASPLKALNRIARTRDCLLHHSGRRSNQAFAGQRGVGSFESLMKIGSDEEPRPESGSGLS